MNGDVELPAFPCRHGSFQIHYFIAMLSKANRLRFLLELDGVGDMIKMRNVDDS